MPKVIIADDFSTQRSLIKMMVESTGINTIEAKNGTEVLKLLQENQNVDGIITDLEMPEMDGLELTSQLRNQPTTKDLPVIMITSVEDSRTEAKQTGVNHFIHKPFDKNDVTRAIEQHILNQNNEFYKVLLVSDDNKQVLVWEKSLELPYFSFIKADSARNALKQLRDYSIDAIVTDYKMPEVDGQMFVRKIKSMPEFNNLPVLMLAEPQYYEEIDQGHGIEQVFTKPFNSEVLKSELKKVLRIN